MKHCSQNIIHARHNIYFHRLTLHEHHFINTVAWHLPLTFVHLHMACGWIRTLTISRCCLDWGWRTNLSHIYPPEVNSCATKGKVPCHWNSTKLYLLTLSHCRCRQIWKPMVWFETTGHVSRLDETNVCFPSSFFILSLCSFSDTNIRNNAFAKVL